MLKWFIRRRLDQFEAKFGYDVSYMREMLETDLDAVMTLGKLEALGKYKKDVPRDVLAGAGLTTVIAQDCGPCAQLGVAMALADGVPAATVAAIVAGDELKMSPEVALGARYARALLVRSAAADDLREEIVRRWGKRALIAIAFGVSAATVFPTVKYALGHGHACTRLTVDGQAIVPVQRVEPVVRAQS